MFCCTVCRFDVQLDDVVIKTASINTVVCLRCFGRETGSHLAMPRTLMRQMQAVLSEIDVK